MPEYTFLEGDKVNASDIRRLIELTTAGTLRWEHSDTACAVSAHPADQAANDSRTLAEELVGANLRGIRVGYDPSTNHWHYLRLTSHEWRQYYVEAGSPSELMELGEQLYSLARKAERLCGTLKSAADEMHFCKTCGEETPHKHLVDSPYGIQQIVMHGTERLVCVQCETAVYTADQPG